jgi:hypothetical protein
MKKRFDRSAEDLGNVVGLEHVNLIVPDHQVATLFYITGLGFTRDPFLNTGVRNMWVNMGRSQFHLPIAMPGQSAQVVRGHVGMVVPDTSAVAHTLGMIQEPLKKTKFAFKVRNSRIDVTCPWGNRLRVYAPDPERFGPIQLGVPYVEFDVPAGTAEGIARFYGEVLGAFVEVENGAAKNGKNGHAKNGNGKKGGAKAAKVSVGYHQHLIFRETDAALPAYDGHHLQLYVANFSAPHRKLVAMKLELEESNQHQYRFYDIVDPKNGKKLYRLEHEIRSMTHPLYARPLVNRNPAINNNAYAPGYEGRSWAMPVAM